MKGLRTPVSVHVAGFFVALGIVFGVCGTAPGQCEITKLLPSDGSAGDHYGFSAAIDGDVAVVGALFDDDNGPQSGSAYVFHRKGLAWVQQAKLLASDGAASDNFGISVAISGDVAIVGAYEDNDNGRCSGSAYVFRWNGSGWIQQAKLLASDGAADDRFGVSVAIDGEVVVVGAHEDDHNATNSGSAYVFERPPGGWVDMTETAKLTASDGASNENFGVSVAIHGDVVVVGAFRDDNTGSTYVFQEPPGGWISMTETAKLTASDGAEGDRFGRSVAIDGDLILIGADHDDDAGQNSGSAFVFRKLPGGWVDMTETAKLLPSDGGGEMGRSVAIDGDVALIGAPEDSDDGSFSGSAYVFKEPPSGWADMTETVKLTASDADSNHEFGFSVAIEGDVAVISARGDDDNGDSSGSAYVFAGLVGIDCNSNGQPDACDIADGTSKDANGNGIPDECEPDLDIKPGSCPNSFNRNSNGVLPVALVGTDDFDVTEVDLASILLVRTDGFGGSIAPHEGPPGPHSELEDVATPFEGEEQCDCDVLGGDGILDLSMKFKSADLVDALELDDLKAGDFVSLTLTGNLLDGTPFEAADCIQIVPPGELPGLMAMESTAPGVFIDVTPLDETLDGGGFVDFKRTYLLGTIVTITAPPTHPGWVFVGWDFDDGGLSSFTVTRQGGFGLQPDDRTIEIIVLDEFSLKAIYRPSMFLP